MSGPSSLNYILFQCSEVVDDGWASHFPCICGGAAPIGFGSRLLVLHERSYMFLLRSGYGKKGSYQAPTSYDFVRSSRWSVRPFISTVWQLILNHGISSEQGVGDCLLRNSFVHIRKNSDPMVLSLLYILKQSSIDYRLGTASQAFSKPACLIQASSWSNPARTTSLEGKLSTVATAAFSKSLPSMRNSGRP